MRDGDQLDPAGPMALAIFADRRIAHLAARARPTIINPGEGSARATVQPSRREEALTDRPPVQFERRNDCRHAGVFLIVAKVGIGLWIGYHRAGRHISERLRDGHWQYFGRSPGLDFADEAMVEIAARAREIGKDRLLAQAGHERQHGLDHADLSCGKGSGTGHVRSSKPVVRTRVKAQAPGRPASIDLVSRRSDKGFRHPGAHSLGSAVAATGLDPGFGILRLIGASRQARQGLPPRSGVLGDCRYASVAR